MIKRILSVCVVIIIFIMVSCKRYPETITLESLLAEMTNRSALSYFPDKQLSTGSSVAITGLQFRPTAPDGLLMPICLISSGLRRMISGVNL